MAMIVKSARSGEDPNLEVGAIGVTPYSLDSAGFGQATTSASDLARERVARYSKRASAGVPELCLQNK